MLKIYGMDSGGGLLEVLEGKKEMRIGFDLDGVICRTNVGIWVLLKGDVKTQMLVVADLIPTLNPFLFTHEEDEVYIITARHYELKEVTKNWCKKFFPTIKLIHVKVPLWKNQDEWDNWRDRTAREKAKIINKLGLDVYFEDIPFTVTRLRELCPNCRIIQYGGRIRSELRTC